MILQHYSYADFKAGFYSRVKDTRTFQVDDTNFIKVIMENLVTRYGIKGKIRAYIFYPFPIAYMRLKRAALMRNRNITGCFRSFEEKFRGKKFEAILVDNGRTLVDKDERVISTYYHTIRSFLEKKGKTFLHYYEKHEKTIYSDDFSDKNFKEVIKYSSITSFDTSLINKLKTLFSNCKKSGYFNKEELLHIKSGLTVFFEAAKVWNYYLQKFQPKKIFILGHYHREGLIYAAKKNNVEVVELQHGLIAEEDIFYVMPGLFSDISGKSLFADKLLTYGSYWSELLKKGHEYSPDQIRTLGYYLYEEKSGTKKEENLLKQFCDNSKIVLITTQPALHADFCDYISRWLDRGPDHTKFIIKLHPADIETWYDQLKGNPNILITRTRLEVLFKYTTLHLTSYSTTIYDAMRYGIESYSLNFPSSTDYVNKIVKEGFSTLVELNEFPPVDSTQKKSLSPEKFFHSPDFDMLWN